MARREPGWVWFVVLMAVYAGLGALWWFSGVEATVVSVPQFSYDGGLDKKPVEVGIPFPNPKMPRPVVADFEYGTRWVAGGTRELNCFTVVTLEFFDAGAREWVYCKRVYYPDISKAYGNVYAVTQGVETVGWLRLPAVEGEIDVERARVPYHLGGSWELGYDWKAEP